MDAVRHTAREPSAIRVLLVGCDRQGADRLRAWLAAAGAERFEVEEAAGLAAALRALPDARCDALLLDCTSSGVDAAEALAALREAAPEVPVVALVGGDDEGLALEAVRLGAQDGLAEGSCDGPLLGRTLRHAVERQHMLRTLQAVRQREHFLATHDSLTGLANRFHFHDLLRRALDQGARQRRALALLFVDLDRFKQINDSLGQAGGDELLKAAAERLLGSTRKSDIVARLGPDQFAVLVPDVRRDYDPAKVAQNLLEALARPFPLAEGEWPLTASIGIALFPRDGRDPDALLRHAEAAMAASKARSPGRYHYYTGHMDVVAGARLELEKRLHEAVQRGEFVLHFQPQVDVVAGRIIGAEALIRWQLPGRGLVPPGEFIPIAEETGMIGAIGEWVLSTACREAARWNATRAEPIRVGVNVSARQLDERGFAAKVARILEETGLDASRLDLEITESSVLQPGGRTMATLVLLRRLGVCVSIDDFGTGYSSLTALMNLPVSGFKIDRSFTHDIASNAANATLTGALIAIARGLGLLTIAEGVETREQMRLLREQGCAHMQGYLFGKPVAVEEFAEQLELPDPPWSLE